jgi:hypothetical protein
MSALENREVSSLHVSNLRSPRSPEGRREQSGRLKVFSHGVFLLMTTNLFTYKIDKAINT